ncbi:MAG: hypothetical protein CMJ41_04215 [Phycisphaerae bacterium]|nr:hypothetical protein [Phycisphaerae bacterium]
MTRPRRQTIAKALLGMPLLAGLGGCSSGSWSGMQWSDDVNQSDFHLFDMRWPDLQRQKSDGGVC